MNSFENLQTRMLSRRQLGMHALALSAGLAAGPRAQAAAKGTAVLGIDTDPPTLNIGTTTDFTAGDVSAKILEGLIYLDPNYEPKPVQVVFQDTGGSLNPRHTIAQSIALPLRYNRGLDGAQAAREVDALLEQVSLPAAHFRQRLPHELSGGQRQRVGIARALASQPAVVIADEPVSALDVSVRAQILRLMYDLQQQRGLAYLFITHDLGVVRAFAQRVAVMYQGRIVEQGTADAVLDAPQHAYTQALLAATPVPDPRRQRQQRDA